MSGYLLIKKTLFQDVERAQGSSPSAADVRRPYMGIQAREDLPGVLSVVRKDGTELSLLDYASSRKDYQTTSYSNFIIQQMVRVENEKVQIQETWGEDYLIVFGKRPLVLQVQGLLITAPNFPWEAEFWFNYEHTLRATRLAELGARVFLQVDNFYCAGYINNAQAQREEQIQNKVPFSFTMFCTNTGYVETQKTNYKNYSLAAQDQSTIHFTYPSQIDEGEYLQRAVDIGTDYAFLRSRKPTNKQWRDKRKQLFEGEKGERTEQLAKNPQKYAKMVGALQHDTEKSYTRPLGRGWTGKGTGKTNKDLWELPPEDHKSSLTQAAKVLSTTLVTENSPQSGRDLSVEAESRAFSSLGLPIPSSGMSDRPSTLTQKHYEDLFEIGHRFLSSAQSVLEIQIGAPDGMLSLGQGIIASIEHAQRSLHKAALAGADRYRLPRIGAFFLGA